MKVIINFTQFCPTLQWPDDNYLVDVDSVVSQLGYKLLKQTCGMHIASERPHIHTMVLCELMPCVEMEIITLFGTKKVIRQKKYKHLNRKIQDILKDMQHNTEVKISFYYDDGSVDKYDRSYDEDAMKYPFKEYDHLDLIRMNKQRGFTKAECERMRVSAHDLWCAAQAKKLREQKIEENKKTEYANFKRYVKDNLHGMLQADGFTQKVKMTVRVMLQYYKEKEKKFRMNSLKDEAVNFLYHQGLLSEEEIIDKLYI